MEDYDKLINGQLESILSVMDRRNVSAEDRIRIREAFEFAREAHAGQKRKSGAPYIIHPVAVARIVAEELQLGPNPVIAAFLHDVAEDTSFTLDDIKARFGPDVAYLVRVVTKQKKMQYETSKQVENFKQMLDSLHYDIRAILIKLADRLHNMRTLDSMRPEKQMKIAGETDYFYAPLANRLGLYGIRRELENLSLRYRCPLEYQELERAIEADKAEDRQRLDAFTGEMLELLRRKGIQARTEVRYRMPYSIWRKIQSTGRDFKHLDYRHVVRLIYPAEREEDEKRICLHIYSILTDRFKEKPGSIVNFIDSPKENGYQSFHIRLLSEHGIWEEIHISSERMVLNSKLGCAVERMEGAWDNWIAKFRALLKDAASQTAEGWFMDSVVSSLYNEDITVFTPQGKPINLPQRATVLDFAFELHNSIGAHAQYAKVNGKLCSVKTELHHGDCVEVGVNPEFAPRPDWLDCVQTYKAKSFLRSYLGQIKSIPKNRCLCCHPLPGNEVIGFRELDGTITIHKRDCALAIRQASQDGDSIVSVDFPEDKDVFYPVRINVRAVDRYHLLIDLVDCITNGMKLSISSLNTETVDEIADCTINFSVHSFSELQKVIASISSIDGVDEVHRVEL
ncbi:guanosine-3'5'-bis(Diphosphate) 3'-pyrophosphohydrolase [Bacteroides sp. CAG:633]|mgnify:FL=1|uniref:RelA/SpoT family protein n=1 Tax=Bacteroides sp. CAG:633 TaxID=1262744 RepID=UPI00034136D5|nr:HD domain-containing protein [Bacteroides sp. CAG:633]CDB11884.1 guanosine-3'5'-bis(Diphosphate) 3'-pyrophosphohydrolase [Bacteroides sp. CAG:633]